jgi:hypothetical protein
MLPLVVFVLLQLAQRVSRHPSLGLSRLALSHPMQKFRNLAEQRIDMKRCRRAHSGLRYRVFSVIRASDAQSSETI